MSIPIITYPKPTSLAARTLARFLMGECSEHRDTDKETGSYRLSALVHYLEKHHGWLFEREQVREQTPDPIGRYALFTRYWLDRAVIAWAGPEGQEFAERVLHREAKRIAAREAATSLTAEIQRDKPINLNQENNTHGILTQLISGAADKESEFKAPKGHWRQEG